MWIRGHYDGSTNKLLFVGVRTSQYVDSTTLAHYFSYCIEVVGIVATQQSQDKIENKTHFQAPQHKLSPVREVARAFETELHIIYYVAGEK